jgi:hypothetical protein
MMADGERIAVAAWRSMKLLTKPTYWIGCFTGTFAEAYQCELREHPRKNSTRVAMNSAKPASFDSLR